MTTGEAIRSRRGAARLSQADLAEQLGVSRVTVSMWERDEAVPSESNIARMAALFGVSESQLRYPDEAPGYGVSKADLARVPGLSDALLQMPDHVHDVVWPFLGQMERAGLGTEARDRVHALATQLSTGHFTPGHKARSVAVDIADAQDIVETVRRIYARRGVTIGASAGVASTEDPDAVSGAAFERSLRSGKRKPKAG